MSRSTVSVPAAPASTPMKTPRLASRLLPSSLALLGSSLLAHESSARAVNGQWAEPKNGGWGAAQNWVGGVIAGGVDATATFDGDGAQTISVGVDTGRTVGHLVLKGRRPWDLNGSRLTLAVSGADEQPTITVLDGHHLLPCGLAGNQGFVKRGGSHLYLSGENSYAGATFVTGGHLYAMNPRSLGLTGPGNNTIVTQTAQLHVSRGVVIDEDIVLFRTSPGDSANLYLDNGDNTLAGTLTLQRGGSSDQTHLFGVQQSEGTTLITGAISGKLTPGATPGAAGMHANVLRFRVRPGTTVEISGTISDGDIGAGGLSLQKTDVGDLTLRAANTYGGSTMCNGGLLLVNNTRGSATGSGPVVVNAGATLGGLGGIAPSGSAGITIANGATVAPGDRSGASRAAASVLTFSLGATSGRVVFQSGARLAIDLNSRGPAATERLALTGLARGGARVHFNDTVVDLTPPAAGGLPPGLYTLVSFDASDAYAGRLVLGEGLDNYEAELVHAADAIQLRVGGRR